LKLIENLKNYRRGQWIEKRLFEKSQRGTVIEKCLIESTSCGMVD
jgi:hypothetical protein